VRVGWSSVRAAGKSTTSRGNQYYSRELLMMGIVVPETCCAYKKCNKILSGI